MTEITKKKKQLNRNSKQKKKIVMAPYHILIAMISSVIPGNLVVVVESEQFGPMAKCH